MPLSELESRHFDTRFTSQEQHQKNSLQRFPRLAHVNQLRSCNGVACGHAAAGSRDVLDLPEKLLDGTLCGEHGFKCDVAWPRRGPEHHI